MFFNFKSSQMSYLSFSAFFEYLYYGSTPSIISNSFSVGIVFKRQILTSKDVPRAERVKVYCRSGNICEVLIFARRTDSRIQLFLY